MLGLVFWVGFWLCFGCAVYHSCGAFVGVKEYRVGFLVA
jgi:hypothetical protein